MARAPYGPPMMHGFTGFSTGGGGAEVSVAWPTSAPQDHRAYDVGVLIAASRSGTIALKAGSEAGFVEAPFSPLTLDVAGTGGDVKMAVFWKRATDNAQATPTIVGGDDHVIACMTVIRGCVRTGDPWDVYATAVKTTASTTITCPGVTTTKDNCLVLHLAAIPTDSGGAVFSNQSSSSTYNMQERWDNGTTTGDGSVLGGWTSDKPDAGAVSAATISSGSVGDVTATIAFKPPEFDTTAPDFTVITTEGEIAADDPIELVAIDTTENLKRVFVSARYGDDFAGGGVTETIYNGTGFEPAFAADSTAIPLGSETIALAIAARRAGGWPSSEVEIYAVAIDEDGNVATRTLAYTTPGSAPTITVVSPTGPIQRHEPLVVEIQDGSAVLISAILVRFYDPVSGQLIADEPVYAGGAFRSNYRNRAYNFTEEIAGGVGVSMLRDGGWPGRPSFEFAVRDAAGNAPTLVLP